MRLGRVMSSWGAERLVSPPMEHSRTPQRTLWSALPVSGSFTTWGHIRVRPSTPLPASRLARRKSALMTRPLPWVMALTLAGTARSPPVRGCPPASTAWRRMSPPPWVLYQARRK